MADHHNAPPSMRFYDREGPHVVCIVCREALDRHLSTCPLVAIDTEIKNLTAHVGMCVANIKDSLEAIARLLRDAPP